MRRRLPPTLLRKQRKKTKRLTKKKGRIRIKMRTVSTRSKMAREPRCIDRRPKKRPLNLKKNLKRRSKRRLPQPKNITTRSTEITKKRKTMAKSNQMRKPLRTFLILKTSRIPRVAQRLLY